jgi:hypothetical protein
MGLKLSYVTISLQSRCLAANWHCPAGGLAISRIRCTAGVEKRRSAQDSPIATALLNGGFARETRAGLDLSVPGRFCGQRDRDSSALGLVTF